MARVHILPVLLVTALLASACGGSGTSGEAQVPSRAPAREEAVGATPRSAASSACAAPVITRPTGRVTSAARRALTTATQDLTGRDHRFCSSGAVTVPRSGLTARATLEGATGQRGTSTADLEWSGAASLLLPDARILVRDNRLLVGLDGARPTDRGSASGIALDVGRELHTHPFLLEQTASSTNDGRTTITSVARIEELRTYAGTERRGVATDFLLGARSLTITTVVDDARMVADTFALTTTVPAAFRTQLGTGVITVRATTAYC